MAEEQDHNSLIAELSGITGASTDEARSYLEMADWDVNHAAMSFYSAQEEEHATAEEEQQEPEPYTGPRTLDGRPAPQAIPSVGGSEPSTRSRGAGRGGIATLGSIRDSHADHGPAHDGEQPRDLFAGGEKSGLAVQDPKRADPTKAIIQDILKKAKSNAGKPPPPRTAPVSSASSSRFSGAGMTLGGDDIPSRAIPDPNAGRPPVRAPLIRVLHLWEDGFSIDDGDLRRFDDPQHTRDLEMIRTGRAPLHLMGTGPGQPVDVQLNKHEEKYKKPKTVWKPFGGSGQRLGSPTPGTGNISTTTEPAPVAVAVQTTSATSATPEVNIDADQPTISLRLQLLDGTRLVTRFNTSHTVGDVYDFINRASPDSNSTSWVLATTFPNKDHTDKTAVLGDMPEFRKGGTAVQKKTG